MYQRTYCLAFLAILTIACSGKREISKPTAAMTMTVLNTDTLAIRALEYKDGMYWFAGKDGQYGTVNAANGTVQINKLPEIASKLEFRSIAVTPSYTFLMSAGSPALCYRVDKKTGNVVEIYRDMDASAFYDAMKFWNDREGIILGDPIDNCFSVLKTSDGGKTFTKINCEAFPDFVKGEAAFAASNSNIAIIDDKVWFATGGARARIFHSTNRGENWTAVDTPIIAGGAMTGIFAMDFYDDKEGVVIGGNWENKSDTSANKAMTQDGGRTWSLLNTGGDPLYCSDILYIPGTAGKELLAVGTEGIWWSNDKGTTWLKISDKGFYTVAMEDSSHGVLAGSSEMVRFTLSRKR